MPPATVKKPSSAKATEDKPAVKRAPRAAAAKHAPKAEAPQRTYIYALGRRKSAIAQVRLFQAGSGKVTFNGKPLKAYFGVEELHNSVTLPLKTLGLDATTDLIIVAHGGGLRGQADAAKLGVARCLLKINPELRPALKPQGYLTRDPREKERKKYGLKKARKSPQWAKR